MPNKSLERRRIQLASSREVASICVVCRLAQLGRWADVARSLKIMSEIAETTEQPKKSSFWSSFWFPAMFGASSSIFREFFSLPMAWFLAALLASYINYFALPKPRITVVKYLALIQAILVTTFLAIWYVPPMLQTVMPAFWAYAFPAVLLVNAIYFVPPLDGSKRGAWWKWFLGSLVIVSLFAWLLSSLK